jgi:5-amino-6-(5-phosphoribosylamino)uracil reductase
VKVLTNTALSLDGHLAPADGPPVAIGSQTDRRYMSVLRARADAVLVGGSTFRAWPVPLVPRARALANLRAEGFFDVEHPPIEGRTWWNVVVSRTLDVPKSGRFYEDPRVKPLFFSPSSAPMPAEVERGEVDVPRLLERLAARGVETLLVEGGGGLLRAFFEADVVDEMYVTVCPMVLGGPTAMVGGRGFRFEEARRMTLVHANAFGDEIYCRWRRCS